MEEARRVIKGLRRIEHLERVGAEPHQLLAEIEGLIWAVERWLRVEPAAASTVGPALERCGAALRRGQGVLTAHR